MTSPVTTGIFLNILDNAAEIDKAKGKIYSTPWRVLKGGGKLNTKFPAGVLNQTRYLKQEGLELYRENRAISFLLKTMIKKLRNWCKSHVESWFSESVMYNI